MPIDGLDGAWPSGSRRLRVTSSPSFFGLGSWSVLGPWSVLLTGFPDLTAAADRLFVELDRRERRCLRETPALTAGTTKTAAVQNLVMLSRSCGAMIVVFSELFTLVQPFSRLATIMPAMPTKKKAGRKLPPLVAAVRPVSTRLSRMEALLIEMRAEQDVKLKKINKLQLQFEELTKAVRARFT